MTTRKVLARPVLVDVVAEKQHQVRVVGRGVAPGGIIAVLVALAGGVDVAEHVRPLV